MFRCRGCIVWSHFSNAGFSAPTKAQRKPTQLDYYLDEFTFRFNRRTSRLCGLLFYRLLEQAVATQPVTYQDIATRNG